MENFIKDLSFLAGCEYHLRELRLSLFQQLKGNLVNLFKVCVEVSNELLSSSSSNLSDFSIFTVISLLCSKNLSINSEDISLLVRRYPFRNKCSFVALTQETFCAHFLSMIEPLETSLLVNKLFNIDHEPVSNFVEILLKEIEFEKLLQLISLKHSSSFKSFFTSFATDSNFIPQVSFLSTLLEYDSQDQVISYCSCRFLQKDDLKSIQYIWKECNLRKFGISCSEINALTAWPILLKFLWPEDNISYNSWISVWESRKYDVAEIESCQIYVQNLLRKNSMKLQSSLQLENYFKGLFKIECQKNHVPVDMSPLETKLCKRIETSSVVKFDNKQSQSADLNSNQNLNLSNEVEPFATEIQSSVNPVSSEYQEGSNKSSSFKTSSQQSQTLESALNISVRPSIITGNISINTDADILRYSQSNHLFYDNYNHLSYVKSASKQIAGYEKEAECYINADFNFSGDPEKLNFSSESESSDFIKSVLEKINDLTLEIKDHSCSLGGNESIIGSSHYISLKSPKFTDSCIIKSSNTKEVSNLDFSISNIREGKISSNSKEYLDNSCDLYFSREFSFNMDFENRFPLNEILLSIDDSVALACFLFTIGYVQKLRIKFLKYFKNSPFSKIDIFQLIAGASELLNSSLLVSFLNENGFQSNTHDVRLFIRRSVIYSSGRRKSLTFDLTNLNPGEELNKINFSELFSVDMNGFVNSEVNWRFLNESDSPLTFIASIIFKLIKLECLSEQARIFLSRRKQFSIVTMYRLIQSKENSFLDSNSFRNFLSPLAGYFDIFNLDLDVLHLVNSFPGSRGLVTYAQFVNGVLPL